MDLPPPLSCRYGGSRNWKGYACGKRVLLLYLEGPDFRCRTCSDLVYKSQRVTTENRELRKAQKIRERLGGSGSLFPASARPRDGLPFNS